MKVLTFARLLKLARQFRDSGMDIHNIRLMLGGVIIGAAGYFLDADEYLNARYR